MNLKEKITELFNARKRRPYLPLSSIANEAAFYRASGATNNVEIPIPQWAVYFRFRGTVTGFYALGEPVSTASAVLENATRTYLHVVGETIIRPTNGASSVFVNLGASASCVIEFWDKDSV